MKIQGKEIKGANVQTIVIPRGDNLDDAIVFKVEAIFDYAQFDALVPRPKPPVKILRGGKRVEDTQNGSFVQRQADYASKRVAYICIHSLKATEGLEWDTVDFGKPDTWGNFEDELKESGFTPIEVFRIVQVCMEVNALSDEKLDEARDAFLASVREAQGGSSSLTTDPQSTPSGEPASDSE